MPNSKKTPQPETSFQDDRPIETPAEDRLGRYPFAQKLARDLTNWHSKESLVVGLNGKWGSGKSSVKKLIFHALKEAGDPLTCVEFNPWLVSGEEAITRAFFNEITKKLLTYKDEGKAVRLEKWRKYSKYLSLSSKLASGVEVAGLLIPGLAVIGGAAKATLNKGAELADTAADSLEDTELSLTDLKAELSAEFAKLPKPILVVIDDIDRLTKQEIRLVIQLIKSNADFPNITYLLLYQRETVARSLEEILGEDGHSYLQKIVQVDLDIPPPRPLKLRAFLSDAIDPLFSKTKVRGWKQRRWSSAATQTLWPLYQSPRHIVRLRCMLGFYFDSHIVGDHLNVNFLDLILLETLRIHFPSVYEDVSRGFRHANDPLYTFYYSSTDALKRIRESVTQSIQDSNVDEHLKAPLKALLEELFPQVDEHFHHSRDEELVWLKEMRLCHATHFPKYFHLTVEAGEISSEFINELISESVTPEQIRGLLEQQFKTRDGFSALSEYLQALSKEIPRCVLPLIIHQLFELSDDLPNAAKYSFDAINALRTLCNIVNSLLDEEPDQGERDHLFLSHLQEATVWLGPTFFLRRFKIADDENSENGMPPIDPDSKTLSESAIQQARQEIADKLMRKAIIGELLHLEKASTLLHYLWEWGDQYEIREWGQGLSDSTDELLALLKALMGFGHTSTGSEGWTNFSILPSDVERFFSKERLKQLLPIDADDQLDQLLIQALIDWTNDKATIVDGGRVFIAAQDDDSGEIRADRKHKW